MSDVRTRAPWAWIARAVLVGVGLLATGVMAAEGSDNAAGPPAKAKVRNRAYIVQLAEPPVTAYSGGVAGLQGTKPRGGQKIDPNAPAVVNYMSFLRTRHDAVLGAAGGGRKLYSYGYVFNGLNT